jgi:hypothetical protein
MYRFGDLDPANIGYIYRQEVGIHICIQCISLYGYVFVAGNAKESDLAGTGRVGVVNNVNAFIDLIDKNEIVFNVDLSGVQKRFGITAVYSGKNCGLVFVDRC